MARWGETLGWCIASVINSNTQMVFHNNRRKEGDVFTCWSFMVLKPNIYTMAGDLRSASALVLKRNLFLLLLSFKKKKKKKKKTPKAVFRADNTVLLHTMTVPIILPYK